MRDSVGRAVLSSPVWVPIVANEGVPTSSAKVGRGRRTVIYDDLPCFLRRLIKLVAEQDRIVFLPSQPRSDIGHSTRQWGVPIVSCRLLGDADVLDNTLRIQVIGNTPDHL